MTLIVSTVLGNWAIHASDRLVGRKPTPKSTAIEHDAHSNKTVIVCVSECWIVMGYTGLAYFDDKPTDQFIAEAVSGYDDLSEAAFIPWRPQPGLDYREIQNRVQAKLNDAYARLPKSVAGQYAPIILGAGIQRKNGKVHKVMFRMTAQADSVASIELGPTVDTFSAFRTHAVGMVHKPTLGRADRRIRALRYPPAELASATRDILKDVVLETHSLARSAVGADVMTVVLDNENHIVRTALHIDDPIRQAAWHQQAGLNEQAVNIAGENSGDLKTVSTPFVLTPGMIYGPSVANPGSWMMNNGITFDFSGFGDPPRGGGDAFFGVQPRRAKP